MKLTIYHNGQKVSDIIVKVNNVYPGQIAPADVWPGWRSSLNRITPAIPVAFLEALTHYLNLYFHYLCSPEWPVHG